MECRQNVPTVCSECQAKGEVAASKRALDCLQGGSRLSDGANKKKALGQFQDIMVGLMKGQLGVRLFIWKAAAAAAAAAATTAIAAAATPRGSCLSPAQSVMSPEQKAAALVAMSPDAEGAAPAVMSAADRAAVAALAQVAMPKPALAAVMSPSEIAAALAALEALAPEEKAEALLSMSPENSKAALANLVQAEEHAQVELGALKAELEALKALQLKAELEALKAQKQELHVVHPFGEQEAAECAKELRALKTGDATGAEAESQQRLGTWAGAAAGETKEPVNSSARDGGSVRDFFARSKGMKQLSRILREMAKGEVGFRVGVWQAATKQQHAESIMSQLASNVQYSSTEALKAELEVLKAELEALKTELKNGKVGGTATKPVSEQVAELKSMVKAAVDAADYKLAADLKLQLTDLKLKEMKAPSVDVVAPSLGVKAPAVDTAMLEKNKAKAAAGTQVVEDLRGLFHQIVNGKKQQVERLNQTLASLEAESEMQQEREANHLLSLAAARSGWGLQQLRLNFARITKGQMGMRLAVWRESMKHQMASEHNAAIEEAVQAAQVADHREICLLQSAKMPVH